MATGQNDTAHRIVTIRLPNTLERQLTVIAQRDANGLSATVRRLLSLGIRTETLAGEATQ